MNYEFCITPDYFQRITPNIATRYFHRMAYNVVMYKNLKRKLRQCYV